MIEKAAEATQGPTKTALTSSSPQNTTFSLRYRWYLTILLGYCCLVSSLTANVYFPLIGLLADHYNVSIQDVNLTITLYVVFQGIAPAIFSPLSDTLGRRPVYIISFSLYTAASGGLAFSGRSYVTLLLLRTAQSIGGSAMLALAYAVVPDSAVPAERGRFLGPMMVATNIGPSIGPIIGGGAMLATGKAAWAFWALVIFGASALTLITVSMRETNRVVVGNGSVRPTGLWRTWWDIFFARRHTSALSSAPGDLEAKDRAPSSVQEVVAEKKPLGRGKWTFPNPLLPLQLLLHKDAFTVLYLAASPYASWHTITTSILLIYGVDRGFNDLIIGCCYLAGGAGIILGDIVVERLMDWNYRHTAREAGLPVDHVAGDDMRTLPIERARSRGSYSIIAVSSLACIGYGWAVQQHAHVAVPLVLKFYLGCKSTIVHQIYSALLVDIFPSNPGDVGASNNICRCALSAALIAALQPAVDAMGRSWFFALIGLLDAFGSIVGVFILRRHGRRGSYLMDSVLFGTIVVPAVKTSSLGDHRPVHSPALESRTRKRV